jgi:hypothetical protein
MPKIAINGTRGEINFAAKGGKITRGDASMDEIVLSVTREGTHPIALAFEDVSDMNLFTIDLSLEQAEEFARALLEITQAERSRFTGGGR